MCFNSKSEPKTQATETVNTTQTDYGALSDATTVFADAEELAAKNAQSPAQQMEQLLIIGVLLIAAIFVIGRAV